MVLNENFVPYLGESHMDILSDPKDIIEYIVAFSLINPGFTSENYEEYMVSISTHIAEFPDSLKQAAREYENSLQRAIDTTISEQGYRASVNVVNISEAEAKFEIIVVDSDNVSILHHDKLHDILNIG